MRLKILFCFFLCFLALSTSLAVSSIFAESSKLIIILMKSEKNEIEYNINEQKFNLKDICNYLTQQILSEGKDKNIIIIVNQNVKISDVVNIKGILNMIGFSKVRYFYLGKDNQKMAEFSFNNPAIPYSLDPAVFMDNKPLEQPGAGGQ